MKITLLNQALLVLVVFSSTGIAFWTYLANTKSALNKLFFFLVLLITSNIVFSYLVQAHGSEELSFFWLRLVWLTGSLLIPAFYFFSIYFPYKLKSNLILNIVFISLGIIFSVFSLGTNLLIRGVSIKGWGNNYLYGPGVNYFYAAMVGSIVASLWIILKKYFKSADKDKFKVKYFVVGTLIYITMSVIFSILSPIVFGTIEYYYLGDYSVLFFLGFTAYAIMKYQLFNIKVIATESIVILLSVGLLIETIISNSVTDGAVKGALWLLVTYGGFGLVKSVKHEIAQKEHIQKLANDLEKANSHLKEMDKLKDDFLSMASHELNTPIAAIEGYLSMILDEGMGGGEKIPAVARKYLDSVYQSSKRLAHLVKDLLNVSRIESGRVHLLYDQKSIEELIDQAIMEIAPKVKEAHHTLSFDKPKSPLPKTWIDVARITEIMINMLGNAVKYTDPGGKIEVAAKQAGNDIVISIKDNGKGIPKDKHDRVFQKFTQVDVLKDEVKGTGLGMYISKNLIELHKGKIWFESEGSGKGTTFFFSLPILEKKPFDAHEGEGAVLNQKAA